VSDGTAVAAGLTVGAAFVVLFAVVFNDSDFTLQKPPFATIVIPEGASLESSEKTYEPNYARVFIGTNNTVRWVNKDVLMHGITTDVGFEPIFGADTGERNPIRLLPGESFEYTFTKLGRYDYYGVPGPHLRGAIEVYPELEKDMYVNVSVEGLKSTYRIGEPVTFDVAVEGYGVNCNSFDAKIEDKDEPEFGYSISSIPGCISPDSFRDYKDHLHVGPESQMYYPAVINQTGTYLLTISYGSVQFPDVQETVQVEFAVAD
jgi:plastocyanin